MDAFFAISDALYDFCRLFLAEEKKKDVRARKGVLGWLGGVQVVHITA